MRYMMLIAGDEAAWLGRPAAETEAHYTRVHEWWNARVAAGTIVEGHQLQPSETATTIRRNGNGGATTTDGPFIEGKEMVGGYAILDVADLDEALAVAASWPAGDTLELRPVVERA